MHSYAQKKQSEQIEKQLREQRRRQQEASERKYVKPKKSAIPRPTGLAGKLVDQNSVQLEWYARLALPSLVALLWHNEFVH